MNTGTPIVRTSVYEGPLDLLLDLIERRKLLINDISIASVADEYIERIKLMDSLPVAEMTQFVSLAAMLVLIKSRSLLPQLPLTINETGDIKELEYRLAIYKIVRDSSRKIAFDKKILFPGEAPERRIFFIPDNSINLLNIQEAIRSVIKQFPTSAELPSVTAKKILTLEEVVESLSKRVSSSFQLSFFDFARSSRDKFDVSVKYNLIVSFLALLELIKQGIIKATQETGGDITLEPETVSTPTYE